MILLFLNKAVQLGSFSVVRVLCGRTRSDKVGPWLRVRNCQNITKREAFCAKHVFVTGKSIFTYSNITNFLDVSFLFKCPLGRSVSSIETIVTLAFCLEPVEVA